MSYNGLLTQTAFAAARGVKQPYISKLVKAGTLPTVDGRIDPKVAGPIMDALKRRPAEARRPKGGLDGGQERARLAKAKADAQELENQKARGELVPRTEVDTSWDKLITACKTRLLAVPNKAGPQVVGMDAKEAAGYLRALIVEALEELSSGEAAGLEDGPDFLPERASAGRLPQR